METDPAGCEVAVVVPLHRQPALFVEAVSSVLRQEDPPAVRVVVVLDGCPYRQSLVTATALARAFAPASRCCRRRTPACRRRATPACASPSSAWPGCRAVFFLDADNRMGPHLLRRMWQALADAPAGIGWAYGDFDLFGIPGAWSTAGPHSPLQHLSENVCDAAVLVRREVFAAGVWFAEDLRGGYEDWDFFLSAIGAGFRGLHVPEAGLFYRRRPESMLRAARREGAALADALRRRHPTVVRSAPHPGAGGGGGAAVPAGRAGGGKPLPGSRLARPHPDARGGVGAIGIGAGCAGGEARAGSARLRRCGDLRRPAPGRAVAWRVGAGRTAAGGRAGLCRGLGGRRGDRAVPLAAGRCRGGGAASAAGGGCGERRSGQAAAARAAGHAAGSAGGAACPADRHHLGRALPAARTAARRRPGGRMGAARATAAARAAQAIGAWPLLPLAPRAERRDIAFVLPRFGLGGVERATLCLAQALREEGWRPHLLVSGAERLEPPPPGVFDSLLLLPGFDAERHAGGAAAHGGAATALLPEEGEQAAALLGCWRRCRR